MTKRTKTTQRGRAAFVSREQTPVVTRTGLTGEGHRVREITSEEGVRVWHCWHGRLATAAEIASTTWR